MNVNLLLPQALEGSQEAWTRILDEYSSLVFGTALRLGHGRDSAADVSQMVWMSLLQGGERIRDPQALPRWLVVTTRRIALRARRRELPCDELEENLPSPELGVEQLLQMEARAEAVRSGMEHLSPKCRCLLMALFSGEKPNYERITRELGIPMGSIGPTRARCLARLYRVLQKREIVD